MSKPATAAERLYLEHQEKRPLGGLPADLMPKDFAAAHAVQDHLQDLYVERGERLAGWKIALTTPVMQALVGVDHPCEGGIFESRVHRSPAELAAADFVNVAVESEIAVRLATDLGPAAAPWTAESVADAVGACMAAIELVDDRKVDYDALDGLLLVADNAFNFGCVLGAPIEDWRSLDLATLAGRMLINGEEVGRGVGADVMGHPFEALAWLANSLAARGRPLEAGQIVMTGSIVATKWPAAGDEIVTEVDGLGEARLRLR
ncbi:MAG: fumarylacetoacetate hydrolase family protein [Alphaproteobacteria bacterium]|jgi:2-oxo-3-hexenedioate decarboxylase/2-keto-4-pentenoate hydratase|nr:fumarylacetoacetate hydrolase family protein [Alphaproteobacteria bacterium]